MRDVSITRPTSTAFATAALAGTMFLAPTASAQAPDPLGPRGSVQTSSSIPGNVMPEENRLVAGGLNGTCYTWVAVDINPDGYPASAAYSWTTDSVGVDSCYATATLHWRNVDTGFAGTRDLASTGPGHDWGTKDPLQSIIPTGPGTIEYTLTTGYGAAAGPIRAFTPVL